LSQAHYASHIANRLQQVLDDWNYLAPQLQDLYDLLNAGRARHAFAFDAAQCMAPLPRAYQWAVGRAFSGHIDLAFPGNEQATPKHALWYQGASVFSAPSAPVHYPGDDQGLDFEAQLAVVTEDVPAGSSPERALESVRLIVLANATSLRTLEKQEHSASSGAVQSRPATALSPVAITPDELGDAWTRGRVQLPLQCSVNGRKVGMCEAGQDMAYPFGQLIAQLAATRAVPTGSVIGTGAVTNAGVEKKGRTEWPTGYSCIADKRAMEVRQDGQASTDYLKMGDVVRIEMKGRDGKSLCGAIVQEVRGASPAAAA
jgi:fumarylacetoacetate (FAA) hydrolase